MRMEVQENEEADLFEIMDMDTGEPAVNKNGNRLDGGGHEFEDTAVRQMGHIKKGMLAQKKRADAAQE